LAARVYDKVLVIQKMQQRYCHVQPHPVSYPVSSVHLKRYASNTSLLCLAAKHSKLERPHKLVLPIV